MADENVVANEVVENSTPSTEPEVNPSNAPASAEPATNEQKGNETKPDVPFHEHPRFKELISEKNELKRQLEEVHSRMSSEPVKRENPAEKLINKFTKAGLNPEIAKTLSEGIVEGSSEVVNTRVAPVESAALEQEVANMTARFAESHADFKEVQPQMYELYKSLPEDLADAIAKDKTGKGLETLYASAKSAKVKDIEKAAYEKGVQDGFKQKNLKTSVSPSGGSSAPQTKGEFSDSDLDQMSLSEYLKNRDTILKARGIRKL